MECDVDNPFLEDILATLSAMSLSPAQVAQLRAWIDSLGDSADGSVSGGSGPYNWADVPVDRR